MLPIFPLLLTSCHWHPKERGRSVAEGWSCMAQGLLSAGQPGSHPKEPMAVPQPHCSQPALGMSHLEPRFLWQPGRQPAPPQHPQHQQCPSARAGRAGRSHLTCLVISRGPEKAMGTQGSSWLQTECKQKCSQPSQSHIFHRQRGLG